MATITGRVTAPAGASVEGTTVSLMVLRGLSSDGPPLETTVAPDGTFRFEKAPWGVWMLVATPPESSGMAPAFSRGFGSKKAVALTLPHGGAIEGTVLGADGRPVAEGSVTAMEPPFDQRDRCFAATVGVEADGSFRVPSMPAGPVRVEYRVDPLAKEATASVVFDDTPTTPVVLRCPR